MPYLSCCIKSFAVPAVLALFTLWLLPPVTMLALLITALVIAYVAKRISVFLKATKVPNMKFYTDKTPSDISV